MQLPNRLLVVAALTAATACDDSFGADPQSLQQAPALVNVTPPNAATDVDPNGPIVLTFNHSMMLHVETLVVLHQGSLGGPVVAGSVNWSRERTVLTFTPAAPLERRTTYVLHISPNIRATNGARLNAASCARLGGRTVTPGMFRQGPHGGPGMMDDNWRGPDGTYGMIFMFTTT